MRTMKAAPYRPRHLSYLRHRRQVAWQIILPVVVGGLIMVAMIVVLCLSTFGGNGDVSRWAAISTIWLTLPVMLAAIILFTLIVAVTYLLSRGASFIPRYTREAQRVMFQVEAGAKRAAQIAHRPVLLFPEIGVLLRRGVQRLRGS